MLLDIDDILRTHINQLKELKLIRCVDVAPFISKGTANAALAIKGNYGN